MGQARKRSKNRITSYNVCYTKLLRDFRDRPVLIVDDILDEGHTLAEIIDYCKREGASSVSCAVLVNKLHDRKARPELQADFIGLEVEDRYIFGYGMRNNFV